MDYLKVLALKLPQSIQDTCSIAFSSGRYLEMNTKGVDKGYGMRWLVDYLGYGMKETVQANYRRIKEEVKQIVQEELERIAGDDNLKYLLQQK
jgi:hypothetical protein